jgi:DNA polymerase III subunit delta
MIHLLMDDFFGPERLAEIKATFSPPEFLELNTIVLDGPKLTLRELAEACEAMPFLADRRLVIVNRLATRFESKRQDGDAEPDQRGSGRKAEAQQFCAYLRSVPETTELALMEPAPLQPSNPFLKAAAEARAEVVGGRTLRDADLEDWIAGRVRRKGGKISSDAAAELATFVGSRFRQLDNEIEKLVAYAGGAVITESDVGELVGAAREVNVFAMVDQIGMRNAKAALRLLHDLLGEGEPPLQLLGMITRQFRLLLQIREMQSAGHPRQDIAAELRVNSYVLPRMLDQLKNFNARQLETIYRTLVDADLSVKTGRQEPVTALDLLVIDLTRVR